MKALRVKGIKAAIIAHMDVDIRRSRLDALLGRIANLVHGNRLIRIAALAEKRASDGG